MSDKHLFKKKMKDTAEAEAIAPEMNTEAGESTGSHEYVYGMD